MAVNLSMFTIPVTYILSKDFKKIQSSNSSSISVTLDYGSSLFYVSSCYFLFYFLFSFSIFSFSLFLYFIFFISFSFSVFSFSVFLYRLRPILWFRTFENVQSISVWNPHCLLYYIHIFDGSFVSSTQKRENKV